MEEPTTSTESELMKVPAMSKRQAKRRQKYLQKEKLKPMLRKLEKEKRKKSLADRRAAGIAVPLSRQKVKKLAAENVPTGFAICIDLSYDELMSEKDAKKLIAQVQFSYSANRRAQHPAELHLAGMSGKSLEMFTNWQGTSNWDVVNHSDSYLTAFASYDKSDLVYLTSESENVLTNLEPGKVYVVGGLVDHNQHKGLCHRLAMRQGVSHARLPIGEHLEMKSRKVLTVNQVVEILLKFSELGDWKEALLAVIPKRKGAAPAPQQDGGEKSE